MFNRAKTKVEDTITSYPQKGIIYNKLKSKDIYKPKEYDKKSLQMFVDTEIQWTRNEKELFWNVIKTHIHNLLSHTDYLVNLYNGLDIKYNELDPTNFKDYCKCRAVVRQNLWRGEYRKAVSHYLITKEFFYIMFGGEMSVKQELQELKSIYLNAYYFGNTNTNNL